MPRQVVNRSYRVPSSKMRNMFAVLASSGAVWAGVACAQRRGGETEQQVSLSACDTVSQVQSPIPARLPAVSRPDGSMSSVVGMVQDRQVLPWQA